MDISNLVELVKNDFGRDGSYDRYPVRFFSMKYEDGTSDAIIQLQMKIAGFEVFDIKDILPHEDAWITTDNLRKAVYDLDSSKSYIVIGFSEYARFLREAEFISLLLSFLELENPADNQKRRIYFPCFALYSQIKKTIKTYHRRMDVYNPLLNETDVEDLPRIFFIDEGLNVENDSNEVVNSAEWFGMWRNPDIDIKRPIICLSRTLAYFYTIASPDNIYNIQRLNTYQDILRYMYLIDHLHPYKKDTDGFYGRVIELVKAYGGKELGDIILSEVNVQSIDESNIYNLWKVSDTFKRWLIQNYVIVRSPNTTYLNKVMSLIEDLTDKEFLEKMYESIFELNDISLVEERRRILASIKKAEKDIEFSRRMIVYYDAVITGVIRRKTAIALDTVDLTKDDDFLAEKRTMLTEAVRDEVVPYLTCFSNYERQLAIWLYRMSFINADQVKSIYPNLWYYCSSLESDVEPEEYAEKFEQYFDNYRDMRLAQRDGAEYYSAIAEWNKDEDSFYDWYMDGKIEYPEVILKRKNFNRKVYVLDGVGAEFLGYILKLLEERGYSAETAAYGKCHLPSITSVAKEFYPSEYEWILTYDTQVIHGGSYYHVHNVEKALSVIEELIDGIISIEGDNAFAITADHGSTVGHKIRKKEKKYNYDKSEHDGRCYYNKERLHIAPSPDYVTYDDESGKQWIVALNQQSLYNNSKYAVHGGATLEEILVPVIIAHKGKQVVKSYRVKPVGLNVSGLQKRIMFKINPTPKDIKVKLMAKDGTNTELIYNDDTKTWMGELKRGIEQDIEINVGTQTFKFRTTPPTKMGDDLFDD